MNKKIMGSSILSFTLMALVACGDNTTKTDDHSAHAENTDTASVQQAPQPSVALKDASLNAVYQHYIHLKTALVNSDMAEAKKAGMAIEEGAGQLADGKALAAESAKISAANDIETQRAAFSAISDLMIPLVKASGMNNGEVYVEYCPMAFNDKGAKWISNDKEIRNPYFGDKMLTCGEITETIK